MTQLIPQQKIDEAAKEYADKTYPLLGLHEDWISDGYDEGYNDAKNRLSPYDFNAGVQFALKKIEPLMIEFAEWCMVRTDDHELFSGCKSTYRLLEEFINSKNTKK